MTVATHLRDLLAKATPGLWFAPLDVYSPASVLPIYTRNSNNVAESVSRDDAALIVAIRNHAELLLAVVEAAERYRNADIYDGPEYAESYKSMCAALAALAEGEIT